MSREKKPTPHGTISGYRYHGCRCDDCRAANYAAIKAWRERNPDRARLHSIAQNRVEQMCVEFVREHHPLRYAEMLAEANEAVRS